MRNGNVTWRDLGTWLTRRLRAANTPQEQLRSVVLSAGEQGVEKEGKQNSALWKSERGMFTQQLGHPLGEDMVEMSLRCSFGTGGPCISSSAV